MDKTYEISWIYNPEPINYFYVENISGSTKSFNFYTSIPEEDRPNLEYKIGENGTWTEANLDSSNPISLDNGKRVYLRNDTGYWGGPWDPVAQRKTNYYPTFHFNHKIGGDIRTLLNYKNLPTTSHSYEFKDFINDNKRYLIDSSDLDLNGFDTLAEGTFYGFFSDCTYMTTTFSNLKYTNVPDYCYRDMFVGCSYLTVPPSIDATTAGGNYSMAGMFAYCTSLTKIPKIKIIDFTGTTNNSVNAMFTGSTQLKVSETPVEGFNYTFRLPYEGTGEGTKTFYLYRENGTSVKINVNQTYYCNFESI